MTKIFVRPDVCFIDARRWFWQGKLGTKLCTSKTHRRALAYTSTFLAQLTSAKHTPDIGAC